jgi:hypothetical protein
MGRRCPCRLEKVNRHRYLTFVLLGIEEDVLVCKINDHRLNQRAGDITQGYPREAAVGGRHAAYCRGDRGWRAVAAGEVFSGNEAGGCLRVASIQGKPKTIEEMNAGILAEARRRHARD